MLECDEKGKRYLNRNENDCKGKNSSRKKIYSHFHSFSFLRTSFLLCILHMDRGEQQQQQQQPQQIKRRWSAFSSRILIRQLSWRRRTYPETAHQQKKQAIDILVEEEGSHPTSWPPTTSTTSSTLSLFRRALPTISSVTRSTTSSIFTVTGLVSQYPHSRKSVFDASPGIASPLPSPPVFHTQSLLFLFGFLFFPCWWIGAFCIDENNATTNLCKYIRLCKRQQHPALSAPPKPPSTVHPSMIANGRASPQLWAVLRKKNQIQEQQQMLASEPESWRRERELFRSWNRYLSFMSLILVAVIIAMLVWYQVGVRNRWWKAVQ